MQSLIAWCLPLIFAFAATVAPAAEPLVDDRFEGESSKRRAMRGPWKIEGGTAKCTQDNELYKKFKDHGPVIWFDAAFHDAAVSFEFKPDDKVKTFVFTVNGAEGHVFRFVSSPAGTTIVAFPPGGDHKSLALARGGPKLVPGEWTKVSVELHGPKAKVSIGSSYSTEVEHMSIDREKTVVGLGFSFGTLELKNVRVTSL